MTIEQVFSRAYHYQIACKFDLAIDLYKKILDLNDRTINQQPIHHNLALCYRSTREFDKSIDHFKEAIKCDRTKVSSWIGLGETYYCAGDYFNGHKYLEWVFADNVLSHPGYEISKNKRLDWDDPYVRAALEQRFCGRSNLHELSDIEMRKIYDNILRRVEGEVINIRGTQGLGDVIQASYFIKKLLKYNPAKIIVSTRFEVLRALCGIDPRVHVQDFPPYDEEYDYFIPITSLAKLFTYSGFPKKAWLKPDGRDITFGRSIIKQALNTPVNNKKLVGIVWRGNSMHHKDHLRSFTLKEFIQSIGNLDDKILFSLQFDATQKETEVLQKHGVVDLGRYIHDLYAMGCFMTAMDYVITVDSAPVHLAGAIGAAAICVMPTGMEDYRWGYEGETKIYETVRVVRFDRTLGTVPEHATVENAMR